MALAKTCSPPGTTTRGPALHHGRWATSTVRLVQLKSIIDRDERDGSVSDLRPTEMWDVPTAILGDPSGPASPFSRPSWPMP